MAHHLLDEMTMNTRRMLLYIYENIYIYMECTILSIGFATLCAHGKKKWCKNKHIVLNLLKCMKSRCFLLFCKRFSFLLEHISQKTHYFCANFTFSQHLFTLLLLFISHSPLPLICPTFISFDLSFSIPMRTINIHKYNSICCYLCGLAREVPSQCQYW